MAPDNIVINRGVVRPIECLVEGWRLIRDRYMLFVGITAVGMLIGSLGPFGILLGPCMCGIHICLMRQEQRKRVEFGMLFKGFDHFVDSFIATLVMMVPLIVMIVPSYIAILVAVIAMHPQPNAAPDPAMAKSLLVMIGCLLAAMMFVSLIVHVLFAFIYPLIVEIGMSGWSAVKISVRAAFANFGGLLGLVLLSALMGTVGLMCCYVGAFFVAPLNIAAVWVAFRRVFSDDNVYDLPPIAE